MRTLRIPKTAAEKKYGVNEWDGEPILCPRCCCATPIGVTHLSDENDNRLAQLYCKKCAYYGHKDGSAIATVKYKPPWLSADTQKRVKEAIENFDWKDYKPHYVIDG